MWDPQGRFVKNNLGVSWTPPPPRPDAPHRSFDTLVISHQEKVGGLVLDLVLRNWDPATAGGLPVRVPGTGPPVGCLFPVTGITPELVGRLAAPSDGVGP